MIDAMKQALEAMIEQHQAYHDLYNASHEISAQDHIAMLNRHDAIHSRLPHIIAALQQAIKEYEEAIPAAIVVGDPVSDPIGDKQMWLIQCHTLLPIPEDTRLFIHSVTTDGLHPSHESDYAARVVLGDGRNK